MSQKHISELAKEELEALDAIFAEALVVRPIGNNGAAVCEFTLSFNIPVPVRVQAGDREAILHRLPAAILRVALPPGYPSDVPLAHIDAKYLTRRSRVRVAEALNELLARAALFYSRWRSLSKTMPGISYVRSSECARSRVAMAFAAA
jgi:RWD domain